MNKTLKHYILLVTLNVFVLPITLYLVFMHYKPEASEFCTLGDRFNCDIVNKSIYADFLGMPVAILGVITYFLLLIFAIRGKYKEQKKLLPYVLIFVFLGFLFSLRLTYIEAFVLRTWCLLCVIQQFVILFELIVLIHLWNITQKS